MKYARINDIPPLEVVSPQMKIGDIYIIEDEAVDYVKLNRWWFHKNRVTIVDGLSHEEASTMPQPEDFKDSKPINNGGDTAYYDLPNNAKVLQDLIEYKNMNFSIGNIFKACYRIGECEHSDLTRELNKILWFAKRELSRVNKCEL